MREFIIVVFLLFMVFGGIIKATRIVGDRVEQQANKVFKGGK